MIKECCSDEKNLLFVPSGRSDVVLKICKVCKCRHFEAEADMGTYFAKLT